MLTPQQQLDYQEFCKNHTISEVKDGYNVYRGYTEQEYLDYIK